MLLGALLSASLVLLAPGFGLDERQLDPRWSAASLERLREQHRIGSLGAFYGRFAADYLLGNLGFSASLQRPVRELVTERWMTTARTVGVGIAAGWLLAMGAVLVSVRYRNPVFDAGSRLGAAAIQCVPVGVIAMLLVAGGGRGTLVCAGALGTILYSRLSTFLRNLLGAAIELPHVKMARATGQSEWRVLFRSVLLVSLPEILSLAGVSVSMAISLAIPLEAIADLPGLGQLAWQAALARDVYLLVNLVILMSFVITVANALADWCARLAGGHAHATA